MFGAIPASIIMDIARSEGCYTQLELDLDCPPFYFIKPEHMRDVPDCMSYYTPEGIRRGHIGTTEHPTFANLRNHLEANGCIEVQRSWHNGDRVIKEFYLNNFLMQPGDKFLSAAAIGNHKQLTENYNNGNIDPSVKNYRSDDKFTIW